MNLIYKEYDVTRFCNLIYYRLNSFLKIAAVFCACHHSRKVKCENALVFKNIGHITRGYFLRQTFNNGGFTDARLTY